MIYVRTQHFTDKCSLFAGTLTESSSEGSGKKRKSEQQFESTTHGHKVKGEKERREGGMKLRRKRGKGKVVGKGREGDWKGGRERTEGRRGRVGEGGLERERERKIL